MNDVNSDQNNSDLFNITLIMDFPLCKLPSKKNSISTLMWADDILSIQRLAGNGKQI